MDEFIRNSIPKTENVKDFLTAIEKKYVKFYKNEKNEYLNMLHSIFYDGASDVRAHIDKLMGYQDKLKAMCMDFGRQDYMVCFVMGTLPTQFDSIRSSYNAQKDQWGVEEMTFILAKEKKQYIYMGDDTRVQVECFFFYCQTSAKYRISFFWNYMM